MAATPGPAIPVTPSSKRIVGNVAVERVIRKLNSDYGLGIEIPDPTLSPSRRTQLSAQDDQYARWDRICRGIQFLFYQPGDTLDQALESFFNESKAASLRWVPKPLAEPGTLPSSKNPPKAQTAGQQWNLQTILLSVIDDFKVLARPALFLPKPNGDTAILAPIVASGDEGGESPGSPGSKRSFDSDDDHGAKRAKGKALLAPHGPSAVPSVFTDALDKVPSRRHLGRPPEKWTPERPRLDQEPDSSSDTSNSSKGSSVFSHPGRQHSTQTTLDRDSQEPKRPLGTPISTRPSPSPSQFNITHRTAPQPPGSRGPTQSPPKASPRSSAVSTVYSDSSVPSSSSPDKASWDQVDDSLDGSKLTPIQSRLQNIWRKSTNPGD
jgi:hypothetical protein